MTGEPILIIDDTPVNLRLTRILLVNEGYNVLTAASAEEGLEILCNHHPQLILVDIQLPGIDGLEFTRRVKHDAATRDITIVALTAFAMKGDEQKAVDAGCDGYITKPIDTRALGVRVREYLARAEEARSAAPPPPPPVEEVVDDSEMETLRRLFLSEGRDRSRQLLFDLDANFDTEAAARTVHQWVGTGGLLGYSAIARLAREAEALLRERPLDNSQLREAFINLTLAFTTPREAQDPKIPEAVLQSLEGKRIAAVGLPANERERLCMALDRVRAHPVFFETAEAPNPEAVKQCDLAIVHVWPQQANSPWLDPQRPLLNGHPLILAGNRDDLLTLDQPVQSIAREFLMDFWQPEEALIRLSMALSNASAASRREPPRPPKSSARAEIVIADDDPIVLALVRTTLQNFGMHCHTAGSGSEALETIRRVKPEAAILDVNMPGMDGYEVLSAIRQDHPSIRVLLLTARQQESDVIRGFTLGADDYVIKPFSPVELTARLKRLLGR
jgi:two-component system, cell cycle response regulator DivK